jgi:DNA-binding response OmpR family regulator
MIDVLIIEDDEELRKLVSDFMEAEGFSIQAAGSAEEGIASLEKEVPRLVLLDIMLPGIDGFAACKVIREQGNIPVIMMSARDDEESKLLGYKLGADDYVEKPLSIPILTAKIRALMRRSETITAQEEKLTVGNITIDRRKRAVYKNSQQCDIRGKMYDLLLYMMENSGRLLDKDELYNAVWADAFVEPSTLNVHVRWLRERLEDDPNSPTLIKTVWRKGYIFGGDN